jgi:hypothetical protein
MKTQNKTNKKTKNEEMDLLRLYTLTWDIKNICIFTNCICGRKTFR